MNQIRLPSNCNLHALYSFRHSGQERKREYEWEKKASHFFIASFIEPFNDFNVPTDEIVWIYFYWIFAIDMILSKWYE